MHNESKFNNQAKIKHTNANLNPAIKVVELSQNKHIKAAIIHMQVTSVTEAKRTQNPKRRMQTDTTKKKKENEKY